LPSNGLFQIKPPGHPYLIETDPALNTYQGFLGSGYLINHLNWSPEITQRRLGDSYYELMLIRDALMASLGSRFVHPAIADERVQYEYLMDNAIAATESLQLSPGIALSREQIDTLQQDIIWMEERVIAGEHVLVPVVYLAQGSSRVLHDGAVIGGGTIAIDSNTVSNGGLIHTRDQLSINAAQNISNLGGTMEAGGDLLLESGGDILNESGRLAGGNVVLQAEGDITHRTWSQREDFGTANNGNWNTLVGDTATVEARGTQLQMADGSIHVVGGQLSGNNIGLVAGGSISLDTVQVDQGFKFSGEDWDKREQQIRHLQTQVTALQNLQLQAGADVLAIAADIRAGESATLEAGGNILLLAAESSDHYKSHSQHDGSFGRSMSHDLVHDESGLVGTTIQVGNPDDPAAVQGNLTLRAGNDITLYASQAVATGQADVVAGGNINLIAGINTVSHSEKSNKEGVVTYRNNNQGYIEQTAAASAISAGGDLNLNAVNDIHLTASVLHSDQVLRIGGETVDPQTLMAVSENRPINVVVDTLALTNESWDETSKGYKGPVKELIKAITLAVAPMISVVTAGQVDMPEFNIAEHNRTRNKDVLQAGSSLSADVLSINANEKVALINADISVAKSAEITANDIVIGAVAETHTAIHDEGHETMTSLGMKLGKDEVRIVGIEMTKHSLVDQSTLVEWNGTTIDAGQLVLKAQHDLAVLGASINVAGDAALVAGNELIIGGYEGGITDQSKEITEVTTISAAVRNAYLDAALTVKAMIEAKDNIKDAKQALADAEAKASRGELDPDDVKYFRINLAAATANLVQMEISMAAALAMGAATLGTGFYASGSAQHDKTIATKTTDQGQWQGSDITVGGSAALIAGEKIKVQGSDVNVSSTLIVDAKKIALVSGGEHSSSKSKTTQEHEGFSLSSSSGGINAGMHQTDSDSWGTQYANTHLDAGTLASTSDSLQLAGALIEADNINISTGTLSVVSLQDTYESKSKTVGGSIGVSGGLGGVTGASIAADFQKTEAGRRWVAEQSGIIGHNTISIQAEDSVLTGALIANAVRDANNNLVDQGNLQFKTNTLTVSNLYDMDKTKTIGANLAVSKNFGAGTKVQGEQTNAPAGTTSTEAAEKVSKGGVPVNSITGGGLYTGHITERTTFATLGMGQVEVGGELLTNESGIMVNRDVANAQVITKDQDIGGLNASVTVDGRWLTKEGRAEMLKQQKDVGKNVKINGLALTLGAGAVIGELAGQRISEALNKYDNPKLYKVTCMQQPCSYMEGGIDPNRNINPTSVELIYTKNINSTEVSIEKITNLSNEEKQNFSVVNNGIFNQLQRAGELAMQQTPVVKSAFQVEIDQTYQPGPTYLVHTDMAKTTFGEIFLAGLADFNALKRTPTPAAILTGNLVQELSTRRDNFGQVILNDIGSPITNITGNLIGHSRGTYTAASTLNLLSNKGFSNSNLSVYFNNPAATKSIVNDAVFGVVAPSMVKVWAPPSDPVAYFLGGYSGSFFDALKEIPAMKRTSYSAHSCPGTGAFRCMPINIPVRLTPDLINIKPSIISSVN
jgi:filamentous hemagglutinin